jgi:uncharacterized protein
MGKHEEEIQLKLAQLEQSIGESAQPPAAPPGQTKIIVTPANKDDFTKADMHLILGFCLVGLGLMLFFNHVQVGSSFMGMFGMGNHGTALVLIPLMVGLGMLFFDYKNRLAWIITAACCALLIFSVLASLVITFAHISMLGLVIMLLPFSLGAAFIMKGLTARNAQQK